MAASKQKDAWKHQFFLFIIVGFHIEAERDQPFLDIIAKKRRTDQIFGFAAIVAFACGGQGFLPFRGAEIAAPNPHEGKKLNAFILIQRAYGGEELLARRIADRGIENIHVAVVAGIGTGILVHRGNLNVIFARLGDNEFEVFDIIGQLNHDAPSVTFIAIY
ncbi:RNA-binding region RNP-1 [Brucella ovis ATCC 25840]|uniref:RNA-binding region RNP-1 n=1 Tax=Brucella ovis (strain ATCC 25840 / 63/290 / NCTC 10512) TaxID=444178 RepID=A0A0H3AUX5_BRUO2|nr:RNA-binding region RNP-1 [Brucella ovis ATCC 25840]